MASLSLRHIYKVYDGTTKAVSDFNMEIRDKEFIVFVGPSGCGKSTTLRMIAGLEEISAGELCIDGVVVNDMEPRDRNIAMVFQNYALYPHMTVYENMAFSLKTAHMPKAEIHEKVTEAARILGITEYLQRKPKALSGGQRQRVALGRAIVRHPKVFLLDEPLSNLDAKLRAAMRAEIIALHERLGTTFIYVTHDQVEAMTMGTRIVVMRGGFVQQIDTPKNLYNHPENLFVAGFIGTPRMNFWDATLTRAGDSVTVTLAPAGLCFTVPYPALYRVQTRYMDGAHPVVVGVRPDAVRPWSADLPAAEWARLPVPATVRVVEALGGETLVYGRLGEGEDAPEHAPEVILKTPADFDVTRGESVEVAVSLSALHVFDRESERTLKPRIPRENVCLGRLEGGVLSFAGQRFSVPPALATDEKKPPVEGLMTLPAEAIRPGTGSGRARLEEVERVTTPEGRELLLYRLSVGGEVFFALEEPPAGATEEDAAPRFKAGDALPFDIDLSRVTSEALGISPLPAENELSGRLVKEKEVDDRPGSPTRGRRIHRFYLEVADRPVAATRELCEKLFSGKGTGIFRTPLTLRFPPEAVSVVAESAAERTTDDKNPPRGGLYGRVTALLDYGRTTYARITLGGRTLIAPYTGAAGDRVRLTLDQSRLTVVDRDADIILV